MRLIKPRRTATAPGTGKRRVARNLFSQHSRTVAPPSPAQPSVTLLLRKKSLEQQEKPIYPTVLASLPPYPAPSSVYPAPPLLDWCSIREPPVISCDLLLPISDLMCSLGFLVPLYPVGELHLVPRPRGVSMVTRPLRVFCCGGLLALGVPLCASVP